MEYFKRILKHYIIVALRRSGADVNFDTHAELDEAFESLERTIRHIVRDELDKRAEAE